MRTYKEVKSIDDLSPHLRELFNKFYKQKLSEITEEKIIKIIMDVDFENNRIGTADDLNKSRIKLMAGAIINLLKEE